MSNQQALTGSADAQQNFLNKQANLFLFDLQNEAREHGFKDDDSWDLQLVTENEMIGLKRQHHLVISLRLQPQALLKVYQQVKSKLQSLSNTDLALTAGDLSREDKSHLAAYPAKKRP